MQFAYTPSIFLDTLNYKDKEREIGEINARCPFHEDKVRSFSVNLDNGLWICHAGCGAGNHISYQAKLRQPKHFDPQPPPDQTPLQKVCDYIYTYEDGSPAMKVTRYNPKTFRQYKYVNGAWEPGTQSIRKVPYRLVEFIDSSPDDPVFLVEGEKDVETLMSHGLTATTTPMGANNFKSDFAQYFIKRKVVCIPDNDNAGESYMKEAADELMKQGCQVKIVRLPDMDKKGDVSDYLSAHTIHDLLKIVGQTPYLIDPEKEPVDPIEFFDEKGLALLPPRWLVPHEFKPYADDAWRQVSSVCGTYNSEAEQLAEEINTSLAHISTEFAYKTLLQKLVLMYKYSHNTH